MLIVCVVANSFPGSLLATAACNHGGFHVIENMLYKNHVSRVKLFIAMDICTEFILIFTTTLFGLLNVSDIT
jgi:hypothetical protein